MGTLQRGGDRDRDDQRAAEAAAVDEAADAEEAEEREDQLEAEMDDGWAERDRGRSQGQRFDRRVRVVADSAVDSDVDC